MRGVFGVKKLKILTLTLMNLYRKRYFFQKERKIELCLSCYETKMEMFHEANKDFSKFLDDRLEKNFNYG